MESFSERFYIYLPMKIVETWQFILTFNPFIGEFDLPKRKFSNELFGSFSKK
jgi:hypothetical protein